MESPGFFAGLSRKNLISQKVSQHLIAMTKGRSISQHSDQSTDNKRGETVLYAACVGLADKRYMLLARRAYSILVEKQCSPNVQEENPHLNFQEVFSTEGTSGFIPWTMHRKEKDVRKPRPQQLVFSTKKVGRKTKSRQRQQPSSTEDTKPAIQPHQSEATAPSHDAQEPARHRSSRSHGCSHSAKHMRPSRAILQNDHVTVAQCVRTMVERKTDAALLVDTNGLLTGILTDRDVAVKVVAVGRDPNTTLAHEVMTPDPSCVPANASAIDALKTMISGQFRHLPVTDNGKGWKSRRAKRNRMCGLTYACIVAFVAVVGILDIAKCLYEAIAKLEDAYRKSSDRLEETVKKVER